MAYDTNIDPRRKHKCTVCVCYWQCSSCIAIGHAVPGAPAPCPPCDFAFHRTSFTIVKLTDSEATYQFPDGTEETYSYSIVDDFDYWVAKVRREAGIK
jgi:hypothetical protein